MILMHILQILVFTGILVKTMSKEVTMIYSDGALQMGDWGEIRTCGDYPAVGFRLQVEAPGGDDTALNVIKLYCADGTEITGIPEGSFGTWRNEMRCPHGSFLKGFMFRAEEPQRDGDDTAGNDLKMYCKNPYTGVETTLDNTNGATWGTWGQKFMCPDEPAPYESYITGLQTQVEVDCEADHFGGTCDDTSLNNVGFFCSKRAFVNPSSYIESDGKVTFGEWGGMRGCNGDPTTGFQLNVRRGESDDTGIAAVKLFCSNGKTIVSDPTPGYMVSGDWRTIKNCPAGTYLQGFKMRSLSSQGAGLLSNDDAAATDLLMYCRDRYGNSETELDTGAGIDGGVIGGSANSWGSKIMCPGNTFITALQANVDEYGNGDETGLNQINFLCTSLDFNIETITIKSFQTDLYLTSTDSQWKIIFTEKNDNNFNQKWVKIPAENYWFYLKNQGTETFLDSNAAGSLYLSPWYKNTNQQWIYVIGFGFLRNRETGRVIYYNSAKQAITSTPNPSSSQVMSMPLQITPFQNMYTLKNFATNFFLSSSSSNAVVTDDEKILSIYQKWIFESAGGEWSYIKNFGTGYYLDSSSSTLSNPLYSNDNQKWKIDSYRLVNKATGNVLDSSGAKTVYTRASNEGDHQVWIQTTYNPQKFLRIMNTDTYEYLSTNTANSIFTTGGNNNDIYQKWIIENTSDENTFTIRNAATGRSLDCRDAGDIYMYYTNGGDHQKWIFQSGVFTNKANSRVLYFSSSSLKYWAIK